MQRDFSVVVLFCFLKILVETVKLHIDDKNEA